MIRDKLAQRPPTWADRIDSIRLLIRKWRMWRIRDDHPIVVGVRLDLQSSIRSLWGLQRVHCVLNQADQAQHALIWGTTGSGKSKLLQSLFQQHLAHGQGVGLLEPHNDLSLDILSYLVGHGFFRDERAFERLVYLDFAEDPFVPFNILASGERPHAAAMQALDGMTRAFPELSEAAPMFKTLFVAATHVLVVNRRPLTDMFQLLVDASFRRRLLVGVDDPLVLHMFKPLEELDPRGIEAVVGSTLRRIFQLCFPLATRRSFGAGENVLDFRRILDNGQAVLINLGNVPDSVSKRLLGAMLMVQLEQAALSRTDIESSKRRPMTFLVDEWSSFAAQAATIKNVLDQTRKFGLRLYLSGQSLYQVDSERLAGAVENCRLSVTFNLGRQSAELQAPQLMTYDPHLLLAPQVHLEQAPQYATVAAQRELWTALLHDLGQRRAVVKMPGGEPQLVETLYVRQPAVSARAVDEVLGEYRRRYHRQVSSPVRDNSTLPFDRRNRVSEQNSDDEYERALDDPGYWDTSTPCSCSDC